MTSEQKGEVKRYPKFADKQCRFCGQRGEVGGKGVKNPKILWTSYIEAPRRRHPRITRRLRRRRGGVFFEIDRWNGRWRTTLPAVQDSSSSCSCRHLIPSRSGKSMRSASVGQLIEFGDFLIVVQPICRPTMAEISHTTTRKSPNLRI